MATTSPFDPDKLDPEFYSRDPNQHGDSDYGRESEGVGNNSYRDATSGLDMETENLNITKDTRAENEAQAGWANQKAKAWAERRSGTSMLMPFPISLKAV